MPVSEAEGRVVRFFTNVRHVNVLVGKWPNGGRIPGGPYTITQLLAGVVTGVVGWWSRPIWGPPVGPFLIQLVALAVFVAAVTWGSGKIPSSRRGLAGLTLGAATAASAPGAGSYDGKAIRLRPPHKCDGRVFIDAGRGVTPTADDTARISEALPKKLSPAPAPIADPVPDNVIPFTPRHATGLDRLLEQARRKEQG